MAEVLSMISLISFIMSGMCLVLAVFFWFKFRIPTVIGDLSGRTARKSIARMRENNEKTGSKSYRSSSVNLERGKITNPISDSETGLLSENKAESFKKSQTETILLMDENETAPLESTVKQSMVRGNGKKLTMLEEVILIHTEEVIE